MQAAASNLKISDRLDKCSRGNAKCLKVIAESDFFLIDFLRPVCLAPLNLEPKITANNSVGTFVSAVNRLLYLKFMIRYRQTLRIDTCHGQSSSPQSIYSLSGRCMLPHSAHPRRSTWANGV